MTAGYISHADLGGTTGHGTIDAEHGEAPFHHPWEATALALTLAAGAPGGWNIDMSRSARETLPNYLALSYYEIWTVALERLVVEHGLVSRHELARGAASEPRDTSRPVLTADRVPVALAAGGPADREPAGPARFAVGDRVRTRAGRVDHHTRLPAYVAGRVGSIEHVHGAHVFPDTNAQGLGEQPTWLYTVVFDAQDLWDDATHNQRVSVDAWEPYLAPAGESW
ncbi:MAG: nitrile hydratase subunit beta [Ilumatobacteraceae bacterium]